MQFSTSELERIETAIKVKLSQRMITFSKVDIVVKDSRLLFTFHDVKHQTMKNFRVMSHESTVKDTSLFTYVYVRLRFLHGNLKSPVIGFTLCNFKIALQ
jgi:hypothetical protein